MESHVPIAAARPSSAPVIPAGRLLVLVLGALTALGPLAIDMYLPALPWIARDVGVDLGAVQLTLSVFLIGVAAGQALYGPIVDRWGRRWPLLIGMAIFVVAAVGCAYAQSMKSLLIWRLIMALGGSASMVIPRAVVRDLFGEKDSARVHSVLMLILGVSPILAPTLGGQLLNFTGWRGIFWVLAGIGIACTVAILIWLPESLPRESRSPVGVGRALKTYGRLLTDRRFIGPALASGCTLGGIFAYLSGSSFVFIELFKLTPQQYAFVFGFNAAGLIAASQINRWLLNRYTSWQVISVAFLVNAVVGLALAGVGATGWGGLPLMIALLFLSLSAAGVIFPNVAALAMTPFGEIAGSASALLGTVQFVLGATAGALVGVFHDGTAFPMTASVAGCALGGWIILRTIARG
ncbi:Bcr/CflA family multidrug efflux MFS transporter [Rariglobus hedericola]|uniref:Bcr/CflA family multidrug efflux MFS transporter n=1 Tax=Rariglobus hedericola TaxID=2597822 RepID=A0A556QLH4_9BACT|nr:Bcr/CflA family multidrug efflux MFS transporter [Rariglobus hedericola]TSJ77500.1 Bcr/CflA family multidrug efflux MFS transporter [Rariglobus hedericola]